ncbi:MAG: metallophosphoesterase, partial [Thermodesulfobacteriota bacterium]
YAMRSFGATSCRHLFIGHSHRPLIITRKHWLSIGIEPVAGDHQFEIVPDGKRRIFNCGSVGQPRDDDPRGCYMILDTRKNLIEFHRVAYDTEKTAQAIGAAGLPRRLGRRLKKGH